MRLSSEIAKKEIEQILSIINQYNTNQRADPIQSLHAGTSTQLHFIGKSARVLRLKESEIVNIPTAVVPDHLLRKRYGICLLLRNGFEHTFKSIRYAIKLNGLISMAVDPEAVQLCYRAAQRIYLPLEQIELHQLMTNTIVQMQQRNYIRSLKLLTILIANLKFIYPDNEKNIFFIDLLKKEQRILEKLYPQHDIKKYFNRYLPRIEKMLNEQAFWRADDSLREVLFNHYPILYCSTLDSANLFSKCNRHKDELNFANIKMLFTTSPNVERLKVQLKELGLFDRIEVHGFQHFLDDPPLGLQDLDQARAHFENSNSLKMLKESVVNHPSLLKESDIVGKKLVRCVQKYLVEKNSEDLQMAKWLLKNTQQVVLSEVKAFLNREVNFELLNNLQIKVGIDKSYLTKLDLIDATYAHKLQDLAYLKHLYELRQKISDLANLIDYETSQQALQIHESLEPKPSLFAERDRYLWEYLTRLQNFYAVLVEDEKQHAEYKENIGSRLSFVKAKYVELLQEYQKQHLIDVLMMSELHRAMMMTMAIKKPKWLSRLFWPMKK